MTYRWVEITFPTASPFSFTYHIPQAKIADLYPATLPDYESRVDQLFRDAILSDDAITPFLSEIPTSITVYRIPYPATPQFGSGAASWPSFCYAPRTCRGRTACPKHPACTE